jgi:hypothetical protein
MSTLRRARTTVLFDALYWIGVAMTLACLAFVFAGNMELFWRFEHEGFPMSWAFGISAVLAFLAAEVCPQPQSATRVSEEECSTSGEWEAVEL